MKGLVWVEVDFEKFFKHLFKQVTWFSEAWHLPQNTMYCPVYSDGDKADVCSGL